MTQWLIEEASFAALEAQEAKWLRENDPEEAEAKRLLARHAELTAMRDAR